MMRSSLLRNCQPECGGDGESAGVSGLNEFSSLMDSPPNSCNVPSSRFRPRRQRRRRGDDTICARNPSAKNGQIQERIVVGEADGVLRNNVQQTRPSSSSSSCRVHSERTTTTTTTTRERRCTRNDRLLDHVSYSAFSSSSSTSLSFYDNLDWPIFMFLFTLFFTVADACSTRPSPKPRPPRPIWSPDVGYGVVKENCTDDYAELYCMNSGKCYRQKILETFIVSCECLPGYVGTRCQYRDVPDKYLPVQQRIETASIAGGVTVLIIIVTVFTMLTWLYYRRRRVFTHLETQRNQLPAGCV